MISRKMRLTDGVITLKPVDLNGVSAHFESIIASKKELKPWMPWMHQKYSIKETRGWVQLQLKNWKKDAEYSFGIWDAKTHQHLGGCGLNKIDHINQGANLGYWVRSDSAGRGIASRATRLLAKFGLHQLKFKRIEISMAVQNKGSRRVAEKAGAVYEGVLRNKITQSGKIVDAFMFSLIPGDLKK